METNSSAAREAQQHRQLNNMKLTALFLLLLMCALFFLSRKYWSFSPWMPWIQAFAEAAMVGALADWFAVTAIFRHPLGLPIPHTAIIPRNKNRIALTLGSFVQTNFLNEENISSKIKALNPASSIAAWLSDPLNARKISQEFSSALPAILKSYDDSIVRAFIQRMFMLAINEVPLAKSAGSILETLTSNQKHHKLTNDGLTLLERLLIDHQDYIKDTISRELPWYVPAFIHNKVYGGIIEKIREKIAEINSDPNHPAREKFYLTIEKFIRNLKSNPEFHKKGEEVKQWLVSNANLKEYAGLVWDDLRLRIIMDLNDEESKLKQNISLSLLGFGKMLSSDHSIQLKINDAAVSAIKSLVENHKEDIASLISDTVKRWDSDTIIEKLELQFGKDLQYIRLNGTIVGGLAGLLIYFIS